MAAGRDLLEAGGLEAVTMVAVAVQVGVRAPSLYKWLPDRGALIGAIAADVFDDLGRRLAPLTHVEDLAVGIRTMADAYRAFAHAHPRAYALLFLDLPPGSRPPAEHNARAAAPLLELTSRLAGPDRALDAARLLAAFSHGFVSMELSGSFRLGGDVESAYRYGVDVLVASIGRSGDPPG